MKLAETGILLHFCGRQGRTIVVVQSSSLMVMDVPGALFGYR
jgi:hypothetical protein